MTHAAEPTELALRPLADDDLAFSLALFRETRGAMLGALGLGEAQTAALLAQQHEAQRRHYAAGGAAFLLIVEAERPVGRLCLNRRDPAEIRVVDVSVMAEAQGRGIGAAVLRRVMQEARTQGRAVALSVDPRNPARRLYQRLGFVDAGTNGPDLLMVWRG